MSIVVYDRAAIASDNQAISGALRAFAHKMRKLDDGRVLAWTGGQGHGLALARWFLEGARALTFPSQPPDDWCRLIVASKTRAVVYEGSPDPQEVYGPYAAWGSGRDFALGALALGATAYQAVEVANTLCVSCGFGVTVFTFDECKGHEVEDEMKKFKRGELHSGRVNALQVLGKPRSWAR
jgi:ATP-dependent protease HslVU (ClpYQ) peptidase subunit